MNEPFGVLEDSDPMPYLRQMFADLVVQGLIRDLTREIDRTILIGAVVQQNDLQKQDAPSVSRPLAAEVRARRSEEGDLQPPDSNGPATGRCTVENRDSVPAPRIEDES